MKRDIILCLCDYTGVMAQPWVDAGYQAILVDPQHREGVWSEVGHNGTDFIRVGHVVDHPLTWKVIRHIADHVAFVAAFPPCTDLAVSGARWFKHKAEQDPAFQFKAMQVVWQCHNIAELIGAPYFIENPVSQISTFWRKPDHWFHPYHYTALEPDDNYTKRTNLWTGNGFVMPPEQRDMTLGEPDDRIHKAAPSADRGNIRSVTPSGFARAVFESNS